MGTEAPLVNKRTNEYIVVAIAGMVYAVIRQWMEDGMLETPDMMGTLLRNISQPGILNVLKNDLS
jgi:hypothetical protein